MHSQPPPDDLRLATAAGADQQSTRHADDFVARLRAEMSVPADANPAVEREFVELRRDLESLRTPFLQAFGATLCANLPTAAPIVAFLETAAMQHYVRNAGLILADLRSLLGYWAGQAEVLASSLRVAGAARTVESRQPRLDSNPSPSSRGAREEA